MKKSKKGCNLSGCVFCENRLEGWQSVIESNRTTVTYKKGEVIFEEGMQVDRVYFINTGIVKIHKQWAQQKQLIVNFAGAGEMIGYRGLGKHPIFPVTATALEEVEICFMDLNFFESTLQANHKLTYVLMKFYVDSLQQAEKRMRNLALMDVKGRVAETLLMLADKFGQDEEGYIKAVITRQDMAAYAGTTYETFFRMVNELKEDHLINQEGKRMAVLNPKGLEALLIQA